MSGSGCVSNTKHSGATIITTLSEQIPLCSVFLHYIADLKSNVVSALLEFLNLLKPTYGILSVIKISNHNVWWNQFKFINF